MTATDRVLDVTHKYCKETNLLESEKVIFGFKRKKLDIFSGHTLIIRGVNLTGKEADLKLKSFIQIKTVLLSRRKVNEM